MPVPLEGLPHLKLLVRRARSTSPAKWVVQTTNLFSSLFTWTLYVNEYEFTSIDTLGETTIADYFEYLLFTSSFFETHQQRECFAFCGSARRNSAYAMQPDHREISFSFFLKSALPLWSADFDRIRNSFWHSITQGPLVDKLGTW